MESLRSHVGNFPWIFQLFDKSSTRHNARGAKSFRLMQIRSSHRSEKEPSILVNLNELATHNEDKKERKTFDCLKLHAKFVAAVAYEFDYCFHFCLSFFFWFSFVIARTSERLRLMGKLSSFHIVIAQLWCAIISSFEWWWLER